MTTIDPEQLTVDEKIGNVVQRILSGDGGPAAHAELEELHAERHREDTARKLLRMIEQITESGQELGKDPANVEGLDLLAEASQALVRYYDWLNGHAPAAGKQEPVGQGQAALAGNGAKRFAFGVQTMSRAESAATATRVCGNGHICGRGSACGECRKIVKRMSLAPSAAPPAPYHPTASQHERLTPIQAEAVVDRIFRKKR